MLKQYYPFALRFLGCSVVVLSVLSGILLLAAPPPQGLQKIDPQTLRSAAVIALGVFGAILPVIMVIGPSAKRPLLKAVIFAAAGFANAMTLSPLLSVPLQDTMGLFATVCAIALAVLSLLVYMDAVQQQKPQSKF
ncbi:hypothetical protein [Paenarthrobacter nicotinovorans]|uniref:hypothetical protein n=1 Tax=Paenarthrobacter nicotinovorans TaxID=29320 RepID=UPI0011A96B86|nr:hypothetical protein [Paenarthrobacter nicotinovorans]